MLVKVITTDPLVLLKSRRGTFCHQFCSNISQFAMLCDCFTLKIVINVMKIKLEVKSNHIIVIV